MTPIEGVGLPITVFEELVIERSLLDRVRSGLRRTGPCHASLDGRRYACVRGAWALWMPTARIKFLNSIDGNIACIHRNAPPRSRVSDRDAPSGQWGSYALDEWARAYAKPASRRAAENLIAALRLDRAGLGPRVLGLCLARRFRDCGRDDRAPAVGIMVEDATLKPPRPPATVSQMLAAGVQPDKIRSCVRQQVNGYVVDLNSVAGVMPVDADPAIAAVEAQILACAG